MTLRQHWKGFRVWWIRRRLGRGRIKKLADPEQTRNRADITLKTIQGLMILNGGAAVALLTFMGQTWAEKDNAVLSAITVAMQWLIGGLVLAIVCNLMRYLTSFEGQFKGTGILFIMYRYIYLGCLWGSLGVFCYAMISLLIKVDHFLTYRYAV